MRTDSMVSILLPRAGGMLLLNLVVFCVSAYEPYHRPCTRCPGNIVSPLPVAEHKSQIAWAAPFDFISWHKPMPNKFGPRPYHDFPLDVPALQMKRIGGLRLNVGSHNKNELVAGLQLNLGDIQTAYERYHPAEQFIYLKVTAELWSYTRKAFVDMTDHTGWRRIAAERAPGRGTWLPEQTVSWTYDRDHPMINSVSAAYSADFIYAKGDPIGVKFTMIYTTEMH